MDWRRKWRHDWSNWKVLREVAAPKLIDPDYDGPQRIDRYDLVAEIASGGMATVYLARLSGVGGFRRFVAIKRLHPHLAREREFVEMFLDEARLAAGIHHPNVVPILEVGASERGYYLVMEYIEGDTLARLLARAATSGSRLPIPVGIRIVVDMLSGLHAAHELRDEAGEPTELVHRDVSPQNVLVGVDGNTRITDFGVARAASRLSATRAGQLKGKIAYMAPEQAVGDPYVDRRADVFSSGIVLWEVLAARRLFKAENEAATLSRVISEPIPHICEVNPEIDERIGEIVMRSLERDRDARFPSCIEFSDELERAAAAATEMAAIRDVAGYISTVIGNEIAQQREAVRTWLARSEPSQAIPEVDMARLGSTGAPGDQSGMVTAPLSAPLGDPQLETGGRSRTPLVVAAAAVLGFVGVGAVVTVLGRNQTVLIQQVPAAATAEPAPTSGPAEVKAEVTVSDTVPTAASGAPSSAASVEAPAATASATAEAPPKAGRQVWHAPRRAAAPRSASTPKTDTEPKGEAKPAASPDIDLTNPYR